MSEKLNKQTHKELLEQFESSGVRGWVINYDHDELYVYAKDWDDISCNLKLFRYKYSVSDSVVDVDLSTEEEVVAKYEYEVVSKDSTEKKLDKIIKFLDNFVPTKKQLPILKQFDDKTNTVVEPLFIAYGEVDAHGDAYKNKGAVYDLVEEFNKNKDSLQKAISHVCKTDCFTIGEAWVLEKEAFLGDEVIPELQPLVSLKYNDKAFELRKQGKLLGPSIGCGAWTEEVVSSVHKDLADSSSDPKRLLSSFDFSQKAHHLSLTTPDRGGPASMKDWYITLNKSAKNVSKDSDLRSLLTEGELETLKELGEEFVLLDKHKSLKTDNQETPSTSDPTGARDQGIEDNNNSGNEKMAETPEEVELKKEVASLKLTNALALSGIDKDKVEKLSKSLLGLEEEGVAEVIEIIKSLEGEVTSLKKELEDKKTGLESDLEKAEQGVNEADDSRETVKKSLGQRAGEAHRELKAGKEG